MRGVNHMSLFMCILFMLCSTACAILNPYVNLFGIFSAVTTFIMLTFAIIGTKQLKDSRTNDETEYTKVKNRQSLYNGIRHHMCCNLCDKHWHFNRSHIA